MCVSIKLSCVLLVLTFLTYNFLISHVHHILWVLEVFLSSALWHYCSSFSLVSLYVLPPINYNPHVRFYFNGKNYTTHLRLTLIIELTNSCGDQCDDQVTALAILITIYAHQYLTWWIAFVINILSDSIIYG